MKLHGADAGVSTGGETASTGDVEEQSASRLSVLSGFAAERVGFCAGLAGLGEEFFDEEDEDDDGGEDQAAALLGLLDFFCLCSFCLLESGSVAGQTYDECHTNTRGHLLVFVVFCFGPRFSVLRNGIDGFLWSFGNLHLPLQWRQEHVCLVQRE